MIPQVQNYEYARVRCIVLNVPQMSKAMSFTTGNDLISLNWAKKCYL